MQGLGLGSEDRRDLIALEQVDGARLASLEGGVVLGGNRQRQDALVDVLEVDLDDQILLLLVAVLLLVILLVGLLT